mmetsp:Transcript_7103/g.6214  ORF Transcript_7103/g.6214 Transcript_7103/m.6214 type:complete len:204 (+) Transcript_7103:14-625(+)
MDQGLAASWTLSCTSFMLMAYVGFTFLETAQLKAKNRDFVAKKNMMIACVSFLTFFFVGYAFSFGKSTGGIIGGQTNYAGVFEADHLFHERQFPYYWAASLFASAIVSGSMAERTRLEPILAFVVLQQILLLSLPMAWAFNLSGGWLKDLDFFDRGAELIIFGPASIAALAGAVVVGPRYYMGVSKQDRRRIQEAAATTETVP